MTLRVVSISKYYRDLDARPSEARHEFWRILSSLRRRPFAAGLGFSVVQLRRTARPGVRVAHLLNDRYRLLYEVDGELLILVGIGERPGFYRRLDRMREGH